MDRKCLMIYNQLKNACEFLKLEGTDIIIENVTPGFLSLILSQVARIKDNDNLNLDFIKENVLKAESIITELYKRKLNIVRIFGTKAQDSYELLKDKFGQSIIDEGVFKSHIKNDDCIFVVDNINIIDTGFYDNPNLSVVVSSFENRRRGSIYYYFHLFGEPVSNDANYFLAFVLLIESLGVTFEEYLLGHLLYELRDSKENHDLILNNLTSIFVMSLPKEMMKVSDLDVYGYKGRNKPLTISFTIKTMLKLGFEKIKDQEYSFVKGVMM